MFRRLLERVLEQCMERGLVKEELILTDSTHVKANASFKKTYRYRRSVKQRIIWSGWIFIRRRNGHGWKLAAHGIEVDVAVTPGNANDSEPYLERLEYLCSHLERKLKAAGADSAYGAGLICHRQGEMGIRLFTPKATGERPKR